MKIRRDSRQVIEPETLVKSMLCVTNVEPWPRRIVKEAYRRIGRDWAGIEEAATDAQGKPDFND